MEKKTKKWLTATNIIILICILVYALDRFVFVNSFNDMGIEYVDIKIAGIQMGENPLFLQIMGFVFGKLYYILALPPFEGGTIKFWQPITYIFMHQFIFHIIVNLIALYIVGNKVEKNRGIGFSLFSFFLTGIIGVFIASAIVPENAAFTAGSSIAVFGLIGSALAMCFTEKGFIKSFSKKTKIYLIIYGIIFTYTSGNWTMVAHNTGLILGFIIYLIYYYLFYKKRITTNS